MPTRPQSYQPIPASVRAAQRRHAEQQRGTAHQRGYTYRWQQTSKQFLQDNPLCVECERQGRATPATVVDHVIPHKGDQQLFWDARNWQSLCKRCHDAKTVREDGGLGRTMPRAGDGEPDSPTGQPGAGAGLPGGGGGQDPGRPPG